MTTKTIENPTFNYTINATEGSKYQEVKDLRTSDIAKLIRKDLKIFPKGYKFSVTTETFAGGSAINVSIISSPFTCYSKAYKEYKVTKDYNKYMNYCEDYRIPTIDYKSDCGAVIDKPKLPQYTFAGESLIKGIEKFVNQYNFSDCDGQIDYFHVNFYSNVDFHYEKFIDSDNLHPSDKI